VATGTSMTNFLEDALLNEVLRNIGYTPAATVYVGLFTTATTDAGGGTEVTGNAYARQAVTFGAPSGGQVANSADVLFPVATPAGWGTVTHWAIFDALSGGNMLIHAPLTAPVTVDAGEQYVFRAGQLTTLFD
jgi:hypothetical protein